MPRHEVQPTPAQVENSVRERIVAVAREHFFAHGFRRVTMDDLAEELGMSKKTLYTHFSSKTALLEAILRDKGQSLEADLARIMSECSSDFRAGLHRLVACVQQHTEEIQPAFLRDMQREGPELFRVVEDRRREMIHRHFGMLLEEGRREGLIRQDIPVQLIIEILLGAVQGIMNPPKLAELGLTPRAGISAILTVLFEGVLGPEGRSSS